MTKIYNEDIAVEVCERIAAGELLRHICDDPRIPGQGTLHKWMAAEPTFAVAYTRAREQQMDGWSEDIVTISDMVAATTIERLDKNGEALPAVVDPGAIQAAKLRIDTRKWLMSKLAAQRYVDKVDVNLSGTVEVSALSDEELEARTRARLVTLGVEVAAPLLLAMPGATQTPELTNPGAKHTPVETTEPAAEKSIPAPRSTGRKSANDLLGLVI